MMITTTEHQQISILPFVRFRRDAVLFFECIDVEKQKIINSFQIIPIYFHEINLDSGRFEHFSATSLAYSGVIYYEYNNFYYNETKQQLLIEWIAEQKVKWSMTIHSYDTDQYSLKFSFDDCIIATAFKLTYCG